MVSTDHLRINIHLQDEDTRLCVERMRHYSSSAPNVVFRRLFMRLLKICPCALECKEVQMIIEELLDEGKSD
jgi:hypothetical protein